MKIRMLILFLVFYVSGLTTVHATKMISLYQIQVPVGSQSDEEKTAAIKQGFVQMLVRLSGNKNIDTHPNLRNSLQRPEAFVAEMRYQPLLRANKPYALDIRFNKDDLNRLLRRAGIKTWGEQRPIILVWLAVNDVQHANEVIANDTPDPLLKIMQKGAREFGLPLIFPMMDMIDLTLISFSDIDTLNLAKLKAASRRYAPDVLLIGNISKKENSLASDWQLWMGDKDWSFHSDQDDYQLLLDDVLTKVSQTLSRQRYRQTVELKPLADSLLLSFHQTIALQLLNPWIL